MKWRVKETFPRGGRDGGSLEVNSFSLHPPVPDSNETDEGNLSKITLPTLNLKGCPVIDQGEDKNIRRTHIHPQNTHTHKKEVSTV